MPYYVSSGQVSSGIVLNEPDWMVVYGGGTANSTSINSSGHMFVSSGGTANSTSINSCGYMFVSSGGTANSTTVNYGGYAIVSSTGLLSNTTVNGGYLLVSGGGTAADTTAASSGQVIVSSAGSLSNTTVRSGGSVFVDSGGTHTGSLNISGGYFYVDSGGVVDFDISGKTPDSDVLISDLSRVSGYPSFTVTMSSSQSEGQYKLAAGTSSFSGSISVTTELGDVLGTVSIGSNLPVGSQVYSLTVDSGILTFQIGTEADAPVQDTLLPYTLPQAEYMYGCIATATGMLLGYYDLYGYTVNGHIYDFSNLIDGTISVDSRGSDGGSIYDMSDPSVLANFIVSTDYVSRFYNQTPEHELPYSYVNGDPGQDLNVSMWDCLADYLGTGQYWRGNGDLSTSYYYGSLDYMLNHDFTYQVKPGFAIPARDHDFKYGLYLYAQERGYLLDTDATRSVEIGDFSFNQLKAEIDAGRPVLLSMQAPGGYGHMVIAYGYNHETQEVIFDDTYRTGCRMNWNGTYNYGGKNYSLTAASLIVFEQPASPPEPIPHLVETYSGGELVSAADVMTGKTLVYGGTEDSMLISSGGTANSTMVNGGGYLNVFSGGTADSTTVNSGGWLAVSGGGTANNTTIQSYGELSVISGGKVTGSLQIDNEAIVSAYEGSIIDFDISGRTEDSPALVNNLSLIYGTPTYTITVSADQAAGTYSLAGGAAEFTGTISIGTDGSNYGTLTINDFGITVNSITYLLQQNNEDLTLLIREADTVSPTVQITASTMAPTNQPVILTATATDNVGVASVEYSWNGTVWNAYTSGVSVDSNRTVYFRATDTSGNVTDPAVSYSVTNIDTTAPVITLVGNNNAPAQSATLIASVDDGSTIYFSTNNTNWTAYTAPLNVTANATYYFKATDAAGNTGTNSIVFDNIDRIAPTAPEASADITTPTNQNVTVTATFSDDSAQKKYSLDGQNFLDYDDGVVMPDNGTVYFLGIDEAGNASEVTSYEVSNIDKIAPEAPTASADITTPTNQNVTVTATFSDDSAQKQYSLNGQNFLAYDNGVVMPDNGTVYFLGIDEAGNASEVTSYEVSNIDKVAPEAPTASADIATPTNQNVTVTAVFSDDSAVRQYSLDGENFLTYDNGVVMQDNGTVYFRGMDEAGNISEVSEYVVSNIIPVIPYSVPGDLNMDGRADIIMTIDQGGHPADGSTGAWLILMDQTAAWGDLSTRNSGWVIFGTGKTVSGKNTDDVYIKSEGNIIGAWMTGDDGKVTGWETVGEFDAETQIVGLGDFNGNGQSDLLLRAANGAVGCFFTGGEKTGWNYFQSLGDEWKLSAIGDLNGDGRDDVVLKHDAGFAGSWLTQSDGTMAWADLDTLPDGFEIVGAGDFNGDGVDDVLLKSGNYYGAWLVNNGNAVGWFGLGGLGDVAVEQIADFNADGKDDLRIRTAAGDLGAQLVMGADTLDWHYYGSVGAEWKTGLAALS